MSSNAPDIAPAPSTDQGEEATTVAQVPLSPDQLVRLVAKRTAHPEYLRFDGQLGLPKITLAPPNAPGRQFVRQQFNVWDLINDSVDGAGGYMDGSYLIPHEMERDPSQASGWAMKFLERMQIARYYNFAKIICDGPWNSIVAMKDVVVRDANQHPRLEAFWDDVDGNGTDMFDFLEYPVSQARRFGTSWIFLDRPRDIFNRQQDLEAQPWAYTVPTRNVVWWQYNRGGGLESVVYRDPGDEYKYGSQDQAPLMVWTRRSWSTWMPTGDASNPYRVTDSGANFLKEVPCVQIFDAFPGRGHGFGKSNMVACSRMAMDVYNRDSEIREIERKCAFPVLTVNIEDLSMAAQVTIGTNGVLVYNGKVMPAYLEPMLNSIEKLAAERNEAKDAAFVMSEMTGLLGHTKDIQTSSGYHSEVELDKSERRIGRVASSVETAENKIARLFLMLIGEPDEHYGVSYPRKFGMVNTDTVITRTRDRLALNLGYDDSIEVLKDYYSSLYPRKTTQEILDMATKAADARKLAPPLAPEVVPGQPRPLATEPVLAPPAAAATARQRLGLQAKTPPALPPGSPGKAA